MKTLYKITLHCLVMAIILMPIFAFAQVSGTGNPAPCKPGVTCIGNPFSGGNTLNELIVAILNKVIMPLAAVASVGYIIWGGFQYVRAQGKPEEIKKANQNLLFALIGVGVLLGAAGISAVVQKTIESLTNIKP